MAKFVYTNAYVSINSVDLSDHVESASLAYQADSVEVTAMGDSARNYLSGLTDGTLTITFLQDFDAGEVDATLFTLIGAAEFACAVRPVNTTIATGNPEFQFNAILTDYSGPVDATVGDAAKASATFQLTGAVTRDTTP